MKTKQFDFKENINEILAKNIKKYRKMAELTQKELAQYVGMSFDFYRHFESNGKNGISIANLYKISVVLKVSIDKLFEDN